MNVMMRKMVGAVKTAINDDSRQEGLLNAAVPQ